MFLSIYSYSCSTANDENRIEFTSSGTKNYPFFTLDFTEALKHKSELLLSDIATNVEYIPLETNPESLLGVIADLKCSKDYIFIKHNGSPLLAQFNTNGKFIRHIGLIGRGPQEYLLIKKFSIDENNGLIFIQTNWSHKILVYDFEGVYKQTIKFDNLSDGYISWCMDNHFIQSIAIYKGFEEYLFIERNLNGDTLQKINNHVTWHETREYYSTSEYPGRNVFYWFDGQLHFKGWYNDTIYTFNRNWEIVPKFCVDLGRYKLPTKMGPTEAIKSLLNKETSEIYWLGVQESTRYIFILYSSYRFDDVNDKNKGYIIIDKGTRSNMHIKNPDGELGLINDIDGGPVFRPDYVKDSISIHIINANDFIRTISNKKHQNQIVKYPGKNDILRDQINKIKRDDNQILMLVHLVD